MYITDSMPPLAYKQDRRATDWPLLLAARRACYETQSKSSV